MRAGVILATALTLAAPTAFAQPQSDEQAPTEPQLADTVTFGTIATLAPLCGLREEPWARDLRRAAIQAATSSGAHEDADLKAVPGSNLAAGALSYADAEATESFAASAPDATCKPLAASPDLRRADTLVDAFRKQSTGPRAW